MEAPQLLGAALLIGGLGLMSLIDHTTPLWHLGTYMVVFGLGTGMLMQNLVLVVQNTVDVTRLERPAVWSPSIARWACHGCGSAGRPPRCVGQGPYRRWIGRDWGAGGLG